MKKVVFLALMVALSIPAMALAGALDDFLVSLDAQARSDLSTYSAKISAQFGVSPATVQTVVQSVGRPSDAFMVFQLGQFSGKPTDRVMQVYGKSKRKGWGAMAKELGIKPGSAEFHALKRGSLHFTGQPGGYDDHHGRGKGKGHKK